MSATDSHLFVIDMRLQRRGALLATVGAVLTAVGVGMSTYGLIDAARRWVQDLDEPPADTAKRRLRQFRTASLAGADAWRQAAHV